MAALAFLPMALGLAGGAGDVEREPPPFMESAGILDYADRMFDVSPLVDQVADGG